MINILINVHFSIADFNVLLLYIWNYVCINNQKECAEFLLSASYFLYNARPRVCQCLHIVRRLFTTRKYRPSRKGHGYSAFAHIFRNGELIYSRNLHRSTMFWSILDFYIQFKSIDFVSHSRIFLPSAIKRNLKQIKRVMFGLWIFYWLVNLHNRAYRNSQTLSKSNVEDVTRSEQCYQSRRSRKPILARVVMVIGTRHGKPSNDNDAVYMTWTNIYLFCLSFVISCLGI